jgi:hypothetical protein
LIKATREGGLKFCRSQMNHNFRLSIRTMRVSGFSLIVLLIGLVSGQQILGQIKTNAPDDVVRTRTELVQTDVTVVDKRGRFVEGLSAEDFELRVDSKLQSLSFFEQIRAGSGDEEKQLTAARKQAQLL